MAEEQNEYRAYFTIVGDFDPSEITRSLGVQPTDCWAKGDSTPRTHRERTFSRWSLESKLDRTELTSEHIEDVLAQLSPIAEVVSKLCSEYDGYIQVVAAFFNGQASVDIDAATVKKLGVLGLGIHFDPYDLLSDEEIA